MQAQNVLISLEHPKGLIASANILVALHVLAGYQVLAFPLCKCLTAATSLQPPTPEIRSLYCPLVLHMLVMVLHASYCLQDLL